MYYFCFSLCGLNCSLSVRKYIICFASDESLFLTSLPLSLLSLSSVRGSSTAESLPFSSSSSSFSFTGSSSSLYSESDGRRVVLLENRVDTSPCNNKEE